MKILENKDPASLNENQQEQKARFVEKFGGI